MKEAETIDIEAKKWMPPFFALWSGQAFSLLGSQLVQFALVWWLTKTTGSATVLATATLVALLPQVFLGPFTGALVDRWNRRRVMLAADSLIALTTIGLALLFGSGLVQVWHVYLAMFLRAALGGLHWPAMQASTSLMVPKEHLSRIQGLNQMLMGAMNIGSAPMGALLLGLLPMQGVLAVDVLTALVGMLPLFFIAVPQPDTTKNSQPGAPSSTVWEDVRGGLRYVWAWPGLMLVGVLATLINLVLAPTNALQPLLVTDHFKGGAFHLAWMESAWGIGVVAGGLTLSAWGGFRRRVITSLVGILAVGLGIALIGVLPASAFSMAIVLMFLTGFCNPLINGPLFAVLQSVVAPEMQGRVFMLIVSMASAMSPLGLIVAGPLADQFGVRVWYVLGGLITTFMGAAAFLAPPIMNIEDGRREQTTANGAALQLAPAPVEANSD